MKIQTVISNSFLLMLLIVLMSITSCIIREPSESAIANYTIANQLQQDVNLKFYSSNQDTVIIYIDFDLEAFEDTLITYWAIITGGIESIHDGDSAIITFADQKQLVYYPDVYAEEKNLMANHSYLDDGYPITDSNGDYIFNYTFNITEADYLLAN